MAKAVICDKCKQAVPEEDIVKKPKYIWDGMGRDFGMKMEFVHSDDTRAPADICRKCAGTMFIGAGKKMAEAAEVAEKAGNVFNL